MLIAIAGGTALAAFVWLPALAESKFVYIERSLEATTNYLDHFVYPSQLWSTTWGFGRSIAGSGDQLSFSFGWEHLLLIPLTGWLVFTGAKQALRTWFVILTSALAIIAVMMTPLSLKAWELLPLIRQVQFPWRLLANGIVVISVIAGLYACGDSAGGFGQHGICRASTFGRLAGWHAANQQVSGVDAELTSVGGNPFRGGDGVIGSGGEFVLGRKAIIDGDHDQLAFMGELLAGHFMGIEIADYPAAAVKEHQARRETVILPHRLRGVDARRDRTVRCRDR